MTKSRQERAYDRGYLTGMTGSPQDSCPYEEDTSVWQAWIDGWNKAVDFWEGPEPVTQWQALLAAI